MKLLLIDDKPVERIEKITAAVKKAGYTMDITPVKQNDAETIRPHLSNCDLIILDWYFPEGCPTGEETLKSIRRLKYQGPILIYTVGFGTFGEYLGEGGADEFYREAWGDNSLVGLIQKLLVINKEETATDEGPEWVYYNGIKDMKDHFYHPLSTDSSAGAEMQEKAMDNVSLVTTEWTGSNTNGDSMGAVIRAIERVAGIDLPVIILGETGTGKELIAKLLHYHHSNNGTRYDLGNKKNQERDWFMALNCGAFNKNTLDIELFGSLPGAFTDAEEKAGIFEQVTYYDKKHNAVNGGTVFLDEIALMDDSSQAFLLRVLQEKYVCRGGHDLQKAHGTGNTVASRNGQEIERYKYGRIPVEFRLVAATNEDLIKRANEKKFRLDLLYRISLMFINLPPLRGRPPEDFNLLFQYFLHRYNNKHKRSVTLSHNGSVLKSPSSDLVEYLWRTFLWKGNVRELEGVINSMVALSESSSSTPLSIDDIPEFFKVMARGWEL